MKCLEDQLCVFQTLASKHAKHVNVRDQTMFFGLKKEKKKKKPIHTYGSRSRVMF